MHQRDDQACPGECVGVATAGKLGAAPLDRPFGLADGNVCTAKPALDAVRHLVAATANNHLAGVAVARQRASIRPAVQHSDAIT